MFDSTSLYGQDILEVARIQMMQTVTPRTLQNYKSEMESSYGWERFLAHMSQLEGQQYLKWPPPRIDFFVMYFQIKGKLGNDNSVNFIATRSGKALAPSTMGCIWASMLMYYNLQQLEFPTIPNPMEDRRVKRQHDGLVKETARNYNAKDAGYTKSPLYYYDIELLVKESYKIDAVRGFDEKMGYWFRAWLSLAYTMIMRGEEIVKMKFKHLRYGHDKDGEPSLRFTYVDRKSLEAYKKLGNVKGIVTFDIYPNPDEAYINVYKYMKEYYDLLKELPNHNVNDDAFVFPNMKPKKFMIGSQGSTTYIRKVLQDYCNACQMDPSKYATHSLRHGGARHRYIYSSFTLNLDELRYLAGWTGPMNGTVTCKTMLLGICVVILLSYILNTRHKKMVCSISWINTMV